MRASVTLLQYDHGLIRQVIDVLGEMAKHDTLLKHQKQVPKIAAFLEDFVQKYHHAKEERYLFPAAAKASKELGKMAEGLKQDHHDLESRIKRLRELSKRKEAYGDGTLRHVSKELVEQMSQHIRQEEDNFFPRVEEAISIDEDIEIANSFQEMLSSKFEPDFMKVNEDFAVKVQDEVLGPGYFQGIR